MAERRGTRKRSEERRSNEEATRAYITERRSTEKETRPIVIAIPKGRMFLRLMPTRNQTRTTLILPSVSFLPSFLVPAMNQATGCTTFPPAPLVCRPPYIYNIHHRPLLYRQHRKSPLTTGASATGSTPCTKSVRHAGEKEDLPIGPHRDIRRPRMTDNKRPDNGGYINGGQEC